MLSDKTLDVLIRSGWYEGRKIDITETATLNWFRLESIILHYIMVAGQLICGQMLQGK